MGGAEAILEKASRFKVAEITTSSPLFNVLIFSACWALQIFFAKLGFMAGARVLPFQALASGAALGIFGVVLLPKVGADLTRLFKHHFLIA